MKFHVRQYYEVYKPKKDKWSEAEETEFKKNVEKHGMKYAIQNVRYLKKYADDLPKSYYPERLSLASFKKLIKNSNLGYGDNPYPVYWDVRDVGYVVSYEKFLCQKKKSQRQKKC